MAVSLREMSGNVQRVVLIGLSGTGKSSLAPLVAGEIGFSSIDTDEEVSRRFGRSIPDLFRDFGESTFRAVERQVVQESCDRSNCVIATGGGAVLDEANWACMRPGAVIIHLRASAPEIVQRLRIAHRYNPEDVRPLLEGDSPERRLDDLWAQRHQLYDRADFEIQTDGKTLEELVREIVNAVRRISETGLIPVTSIDVPSGRSDLYAGAGILQHTASLIRSRWRDAQRVWIITDTHVQERWGWALRRQLREAGFQTDIYAVEPGESSKSFAAAGEVLDWLIRSKVNRQGIIVALGGGGDLLLVGREVYALQVLLHVSQ
jgi:shikimate kinase / 3-dehydroquinate synthase